MPDFHHEEIINPRSKSDFYSGGKITDELGRWMAAIENQKRQEIDGIESSLNPLEIQILEAVFEQQKQNGTLSVPKEHKELGLFAFLNATIYNKADKIKYKYLMKIAGAVSEYSPKLPSLFFLPRDFQEASFENFEVLCEEHNTAWTLLTHFGPTPPRGLYIFGGYGTGKTHLISAFSRGLLAELTDCYIRRIADFASGAITEYEQVWKQRQSFVDQKKETLDRSIELQKEEDGIKKGIEDAVLKQPDLNNKWKQFKYAFEKAKSENEHLQEKMAKITSLKEIIDVLSIKISGYDSQLDPVVFNHSKRAWGAYPSQPTDLAFATFDYLYDRRNDDKFIPDFLGRRIVIIDDIHPKGDLGRMEFIQRIIEHRYNEVRKGATFVTSNLSPAQLLLNQDYPKEVAERVYSRLREMCMPIEFQTDDYRLKIAKQADNSLLALAKQIKQKRGKS